MYLSTTLAAFLALVSARPSAKLKPKPLPLIIWHGLGDRYDADGLQGTGDLAQEINPGTYVYYIRTDDDGGSDRTNTFFGNVTTQLEEVCESLRNESALLDPDDKSRIRVDALGFSQGGQFLRGLIERCEGLSVRSLVTFGSQHNGIAEFQHCDSFDFLCKGATGLIKGNAWTDYIQGKVVPAQYYRTVNETTGEPTEEYLEHSNFLADINNERKKKNSNYAKRMAKVENFVMYVFADDVTVVPRETGWFAEVNATSGEVTPLRERKIYKEDWIGLKRIDEKGGLHFKNTTGKHMELSDKDLKVAFETYFGPESESKHDSDVDVNMDFPGYREWLQAAAASAFEKDPELKRKLLDYSNELLDAMREKGFEFPSVEADLVYDEDEDYDAYEMAVEEESQVRMKDESEKDTTVVNNLREIVENEKASLQRSYENTSGSCRLCEVARLKAEAAAAGAHNLKQQLEEEAEKIIKQMWKDGHLKEEGGDAEEYVLIDKEDVKTPLERYYDVKEALRLSAEAQKAKDEEAAQYWLEESDRLYRQLEEEGIITYHDQGGMVFDSQKGLEEELEADDEAAAASLKGKDCTQGSWDDQQSWWENVRDIWKSMVDILLTEG